MIATAIPFSSLDRASLSFLSVRRNETMLPYGSQDDLQLKSHGLVSCFQQLSPNDVNATLSPGQEEAGLCQWMVWHPLPINHQSVVVR